MNNPRSTSSAGIDPHDRSTSSATNADEPPFSRLFVLTPRAANEEQIRRCFAKYGHVQDVWLVKDRQTGENRGICYIKYEKASEAALAVENLNGNLIDGHSRPLKVLISNNRRDGSGRDPCEAERMLRLFVLVPKTNFTNIDLRKAFEPFGEIESVQIVTDRNTGDSRGFGYVKFRKASDAAKALEECDASFKPKFAEPLKSRRRTFIEESETTSWSPQTVYGPSNPKRNRHSRPSSSAYSDGCNLSAIDKSTVTSITSQSSSNSAPVLLGRCHKAVPSDFLQRLFDLVPGMQAFLMWPLASEERSSLPIVILNALAATLSRIPMPENHQRYYIRYSDDDMANYAMHKLDGFEYPGGCCIYIDAWVSPEGHAHIRQYTNNQIISIRSSSTTLRHKPIAQNFEPATTTNCGQQTNHQSIPTPPPLLTTFVPPGLPSPIVQVSSPPQTGNMVSNNYDKQFYHHITNVSDHSGFLSSRCSIETVSHSPLLYEKATFSNGHLSPTFTTRDPNIEDVHEAVFMNSSFIPPQVPASQTGYIVRRRYQLDYDTELEDTGFCSVHLPPEKPMATDEFSVLKVIRISASVSIPTDVLRNVFCRFGHLIDANMNGRVFGFILYGGIQSANWAIRIMNGEQIAGIRVFLTDIANESRSVIECQANGSTNASKISCQLNN
ncbi:hypothetical protein ACOME3_000620 [Neoechinorhynchus agilis]